MADEPIRHDETVEREVRRLVDEHGLTEEQARIVVTEKPYDVALDFDGRPPTYGPPE